MSKSSSQFPSKGLRIPADPRRVKAEENVKKNQEQTQTPPVRITLEMVYEQNQMILENQAYIISKLKA